MAHQLDFFETKSDIDFIRDDVKGVKESSDKVRKSMFAKHTALERRYCELSNRLDLLERHICRAV